MSRRSSLSSLFSKPTPVLPNSIQDLGKFLTAMGISKQEVKDAQPILLSFLNSSVADIRTDAQHKDQLLTLSSILMGASTIKGDSLIEVGPILNHVIDIIEDKRKQLKKGLQQKYIANEKDDTEGSRLVSVTTRA